MLQYPVAIFVWVHTISLSLQQGDTLLPFVSVASCLVKSKFGGWALAPYCADAGGWMVPELMQ